MNIGILGTGSMATGIGRLWAGKGHKIMFGSRDAAKAKKLASDIGPNCTGGSYAEAVAFAPVVLLAAKWPGAEETLKAAGSFEGKVLIDLTNPLSADFMNLVVGYTTSAAEEVAKWAKGAKVVKAFNTVFSPLLTGDHNFNGNQPSVFLCSDDSGAKDTAAELVKSAGFDPVDGGPLENARFVEPMAQFLIRLAYQSGMGANISFKLLRK
jgi:8-hydroxy-5-deazaflavin:NADPH oxidoreductase